MPQITRLQIHTFHVVSGNNPPPLGGVGLRNTERATPALFPSSMVFNAAFLIALPVAQLNISGSGPECLWPAGYTVCGLVYLHWGEEEQERRGRH